jgi:hypothetical protein
MSISEFNAKIVLYQILILQSIFYLSWVIGDVSLSLLVGTEFSLHSFFSPNSPRGSSSIQTISFFLSLIFVAFWLPRIIQRTRKCLDFVLSILLVHVLLCLIVNGGLPGWISWVIYISGGAIATLLGEFLCMREETREIRLGTKEERREVMQDDGPEEDVPDGI